MRIGEKIYGLVRFCFAIGFLIYIVLFVMGTAVQLYERATAVEVPVERMYLHIALPQESQGYPVGNEVLIPAGTVVNGTYGSDGMKFDLSRASI